MVPLHGGQKGLHFVLILVPHRLYGGKFVLAYYLETLVKGIHEAALVLSGNLHCQVISICPSGESLEKLVIAVIEGEHNLARDLYLLEVEDSRNCPIKVQKLHLNLAKLSI